MMPTPPSHGPPAASSGHFRQVSPPAGAVPTTNPNTSTSASTSLSESARARVASQAWVERLAQGPICPPPIPHHFEPPANTVLPVNQTNTPITNGGSSTQGSVPPNEGKPKRVRRTNAQIAADRAAEEAAKAAATTAGPSSEKQKRKRRTKAEMAAARALEAAQATAGAEPGA